MYLLLQKIECKKGYLKDLSLLDKFLENKRSFVSHIVHDEVVLDLHDEDRALLPEIKEIFSQNKLDTFKVNLNAGKNYYKLEELNI